MIRCPPQEQQGGRTMEIDRRNLLTGLATSTAAAILPAFPASAAVAEASRFYFPEGLIICGPTFEGRMRWTLVLDSLWHFDPNHSGPWLIRHVPTGLTCRRAPQEGDHYALEALSIDAENAAYPKVMVHFVGWAARFVALHARLVHGCRPWHKGAVFFHYSQADPRDPYNLPLTEDAPPLSPDSSSGPPRGNRTVLPSDLSGFFPA
jgi:hypothetical protein